MRKRKTVTSKLTSYGNLTLTFEMKIKQVDDFRKVVPVSLEAIVQANRDLNKLLGEDKEKVNVGRLLASENQASMDKPFLDIQCIPKELDSKKDCDFDWDAEVTEDSA